MGRPLATNVAQQQMSVFRGIAIVPHVIDILGQTTERAFGRRVFYRIRLAAAAALFCLW
jgi:hypothetical protein